MKKLTSINYSEKNLSQGSKSMTVFIKMRSASIEIIFKLNNKKELCFYFLV